jgi:hypothetical protein
MKNVLLCGAAVAVLQQFPADLNRQDFQKIKDERVCSHFRGLGGAEGLFL